MPYLPSLTTIVLGLEDGISMYEQEPTALSVPITICFGAVTVSLIAGCQKVVFTVPGPTLSLKL